MKKDSQPVKRLLVRELRGLLACVGTRGLGSVTVWQGRRFTGHTDQTKNIFIPEKSDIYHYNGTPWKPLSDR